MRAVLRRASQPAEPAAPEEPITIGGLHVDLAARRATLDGEELQLSRKEFDLLAELVAQRRPGRHPRGPDGPRVGRELVRHARRRSTSTSAGCAASSARRPTTPPTCRPSAASASASARPRSRVSLRTRLLLALAYVLLLAIVALEVPLALNLRDRVDAEVRSQALQPGRGRRRHRLRPARPARRAAPDRRHDRPVRPAAA